MLQMTKKLNWKRTVQHQGYLNREIPAKNASSEASISISRAGHLNLKHVWAEYKDANVSDSHRNIRTSCNLKL